MNAIVVATDDDVRVTLEQSLRTRFSEVVCASDADRAVEAFLLCEDCRLVVIDLLHLPEGVELARVAMSMLPTPHVFVISGAELDRHSAFLLGGCGVKAMLWRPCSGAAILATLDEVETAPLPDILERVAPFVGRVGLFEAEKLVREAFVVQAVAKRRDSRSAAARLLGVPRPIVQRVAPPRQAVELPDLEIEPKS